MKEFFVGVVFGAVLCFFGLNWYHNYEKEHGKVKTPTLSVSR